MSTFQRQQINIFTAYFTHPAGIPKALAIAPFMHLNALQSQKGATYQARLSDTATEVRESLLSTQTTLSNILVREENLSKRINGEPRHLKGNVKSCLHLNMRKRARKKG